MTQNVKVGKREINRAHAEALAINSNLDWDARVREAAKTEFDAETVAALAWLNDHGQHTLRSLR
jgi:hypothetical protein